MPLTRCLPDACLSVLHALVLFTQVIVFCVAVTGGERGIGSGVSGTSSLPPAIILGCSNDCAGGAAIFALLVPVQLVSELKVRYDDWNHSEFYDLCCHGVFSFLSCVCSWP